MIKFLHTADLHLGKIFHDQSLDEDQAAMLGDLARLLEDGSYAALLVSGDVYDRSIPSPDAVESFGSFLAEVKRANPSLEILVIPGNHDSASRLGFGKELFARLGIRFGVSAADCDKPVIVTQEDESCAFFLLPFLGPGSLSGDGGSRILRSQPALAEEAAARIHKARRELEGRVSYSVLAAHLFASGGVEAGSERVFLGNAELVDIRLFEGFDYIALGHLHRCQNITRAKNARGVRGASDAWYPGSPLAYSFAETGPDGGAQEKFFLSVELSGEGAAVERIPVKPLRKVSSIRGPFSRFSAEDLSGDRELLAAKDDYLEIRLTDRGITENARDILKRRFPHLLSLRQDEALAELSSRAGGAVSAEERREAGRQDVSADFRNFLLDIYGEAENGELSAEIELFNTLLSEAEDPL